jgi:hypothetical protein
MRSLSDEPPQLVWQAMNALAWFRLNRSGELNPTVGRERDFHGIQRLRLWDDSMGFGCESQPMTLTVFTPVSSDDRDPIVREAIWQRRMDLDRLFREARDSQDVVAFKPTITVRDAPVPSIRFSALLEEASRFELPVAWFGDRARFMLDVGSVGVEFFGNSHSHAVLRLEWAVERPTNWEPVIAWHWKTRKFLEACLSTKGDSPSPPGVERHPLWDKEVDGGTI